MDLKYKLMILTAGILALTSSLLTALGMAELFQGLFIVFLVIDLGRFLVLNFVVDEWKNLRAIKWIITLILGILFIYSAVGVYNKLNSMIPDSIQTAMVEAASYNKAQDNANTKQNRSENLAEIAQQEYQKTMDWNAKDHENCLKRANGNAEAENKCNNTKRRLDRNASAALKQAMKDADIALDNSQQALDKNVKNQGEIAGVLTTVCRILPNTDCKTYDGLQIALTIIILLIICGLDYLQLCIVLAVNTRKNKKEVVEIVKESIEIPLESNKKHETKKLKKHKEKKKIVVDDTITKVEIPNEKIEEEKIEKVEESKSLPITKPITTPIKKTTSNIVKAVKKVDIPVKKVKKKIKSFTQESGFYK